MKTMDFEKFQLYGALNDLQIFEILEETLKNYN